LCLWFAELPSMEEFAIGCRTLCLQSIREKVSGRLLFAPSARNLWAIAKDLTNSDSEMWRFESGRPSQPAGLQRLTYEGRPKTARYREFAVMSWSPINGRDSTRRGLTLNLRLIYIIASPACHSALRGGSGVVKVNVRSETRNYRLRTLGCFFRIVSDLRNQPRLSAAQRRIDFETERR
jgi:hypothetical protein